MIEILLRRSKEGYTGFRSSGHAGYAEEGMDIVCSAVSALLINTVNSIEALTEDSFEVETDDGFLDFRLTKQQGSEACAVLLSSLALGLKSIEETYGTAYLHVQEE